MSLYDDSSIHLMPDEVLIKHIGLQRRYVEDAISLRWCEPTIRAEMVRLGDYEAEALDRELVIPEWEPPARAS